MLQAGGYTMDADTHVLAVAQWLGVVVQAVPEASNDFHAVIRRGRRSVIKERYIVTAPPVAAGGRTSRR